MNISHMPLAAVTLLVLSAVLPGCTAPGSDAAPKGVPQAAEPEPVTLKVYPALSNYNDENKFNAEIGNDVKAKFPHIRLELLKVEKGKEIQDLVAAGDVPDMILTGSGSMRSLLEPYDLQYDLSDLVKKHAFPLQTVDPVLIDMAKNSLSQQGVWGLPFQVNVLVMFYNRDLLDKFGMPYPKNGMTWDEVYDLAQKMTRTDGGTAYRGLSSYYMGVLLTNNQLSLSPLDLKENKASVNTDGFKKLFSNLGRFYAIAGNEMADTGEPASFDKGFVALSPHTSEKYTQYPSTNNTLHWDMVSFPVFGDRPGVGAQPNPFYMTIAKTSKHKDAAFQVMSYLLSEEIQLKWAKQGRIPALKNKQIEQQFGSEQPLLKGKNVSAFFYNALASPPPPRAPGLVNVAAGPYVDAAFSSMVKKGVDVNTALRNAEEQLNQAIAAEKVKQ